MFKYFQLLSLALTFATASAKYDVRPFRVNFTQHEVSRMVNLVKVARLPSGAEFLGGNDTFGPTLDTLKNFQQEWVHNYSWHEQENAINKYHQYTITIENTTVHFVHEKSGDPSAIPLLMSHGWPGSFLEYVPTIPFLNTPIPGANGRDVSYDVVIPSLPGFGFSSLPSTSWTPDDTARLFNTLMVDVLGYNHYTAYGSDFGSWVTYTLYRDYQVNVKAAHFAFLPFSPLTSPELAAQNITLSPYDQEGVQRYANWTATGLGYFEEQRTRPNTIGMALYDNPFGQMAWFTDKFLGSMDPDRSPPSTVTDDTILTSVSLYYLSRTFLSAAWIYTQAVLSTEYNVTHPATPMGFSAFRYNMYQWPKQLIAKVGNLTVYQEHERGGHWPGYENPSGLAKDLRELAAYWQY